MPLITKAIDTTTLSYQPLWLCCWRGDISSFVVYKKLDPSSYNFYKFVYSLLLVYYVLNKTVNSMCVFVCI